MDKTLRNSLIAGILLIGVSVFYYLVYRPLKLENTRKECVDLAMTMAKGKYLEELEITKKKIDAGGKTFAQAMEEVTGRLFQGNSESNTKKGYSNTDYNLFYDKCLREKGL